MFHDRWDNSDVRDEDDNPVILKDGDIAGARRAVLDVLAEYRLLDATYIAALSGHHPRTIYHVVKELKSRSNHYIQLINAQRDREQYFPINATLFYELAPRGMDFLRAHDVPIGSRYEVRRIPHRVMEEHIMAELEIAAKRYGQIRLWKRAEILADARSGDLANPERVEFSKERSMHFDGRMFALEKKGAYRLFFPGIEAETGSHSLEDVSLKYQDNLELFRRNFHATRYNAENSFRIPYFTPKKDHLDGMTKRWVLDTKKCPQWRPRLLFKQHPTFLSEEKPRPTPHMFEEPFLYVDTDGEMKELFLLQ